MTCLLLRPTWCEIDLGAVTHTAATISVPSCHLPNDGSLVTAFCSGRAVSGFGRLPIGP